MTQLRRLRLWWRNQVRQDRAATHPGRRLGAVVLWIALVLLFLVGLAIAYTLGFGYDSHAYWEAARNLDDLYAKPPLARDAYLYSPAFVQALWPVAQLPWPVFAVAWAVVLATAFFWLLRDLPPRWFVPGMLACVPEVLTGNVYALTAVSLVLGVRRGWPWAFPLLTKVAPGLLGVGYMAVRGNLRQLARAVLTMAVVVAMSMGLNAAAWSDWIRFLVDNRSSGAVSAIVPIPVRAAGVLVAVFLVYIAARANRYWALAVAAVLVSPTLGPNTLTLLAAVPRLRQAQISDAGGTVAHDSGPSDLGPAGRVA